MIPSVLHIHYQFCTNRHLDLNTSFSITSIHSLCLLVCWNIFVFYFEWFSLVYDIFLIHYSLVLKPFPAANLHLFYYFFLSIELCFRKKKKYVIIESKTGTNLIRCTNLDNASLNFAVPLFWHNFKMFQKIKMFLKW